MKEQKNIDKLFQEQLQDFEATPSPAVWEHIEAQLKKKKKERRVIPIWWKAGGVAAILLLLLTVGIPLFNGSNEVNPITEIVQEDTTTKSTSEKNTSPSEITSDDNNTSITSSEETNTLEEENASTNNKEVDEKIDLTKSIQDQEDVASIPKKEEKINTNSSITGNGNTQKTTVYTPSSEETTIAQNNTPANNNTSTDNSKKVDASKAIKVEAITSETSVASNTATDKKENPSENVNNQITNPNSTETQDTAISETDTQKDTEEASKKSIFDAIEEAKKEEAAIAQEKTDNGAWEVTPNVGPVYYSSLGQGSSIDPAFADNTQTGDVNISYGVQVAYNINDRISVRSGVNNVNVGYSTGGIEVISGPQALGLRSVNYNTTAGRNVLTAVDMGQGVLLADNPDPLNQINLKSTSTSAELIQNISYFEVPLELKYKLLNKRFGINMIGGFSTLFLGDNEIVVTDGSFRNQLGEANNLNNLSFTTNIGLGLDYLISKKLRFNLEPMFKYQLNPYSDTSVDFRPYYLGVYSGLTFKF